MSSNNTNKRRSSGDDLDNSSTTSRRKNETTKSRRLTSTPGIKKQRVNNSNRVCQGCEFTFTTKKDLIAHKLGSESSECQEGLFPCQYCIKCCLSITGLNMHMTKNPVCLRAQSLPDIVSIIVLVMAAFATVAKVLHLLVQFPILPIPITITQQPFIAIMIQHLMKMKHQYLMHINEDDWRDLEVIRQTTDTPFSVLMREGLRNIVKEKKEKITEVRKMRNSLSDMVNA